MKVEEAKDSKDTGLQRKGKKLLLEGSLETSSPRESFKDRSRQIDLLGYSNEERLIRRDFGS